MTLHASKELMKLNLTQSIIFSAFVSILVHQIVVRQINELTLLDVNDADTLFRFFDIEDWPGGALFLVGVANIGLGLFRVGSGGLVCRSPRLFGFFRCLSCPAVFLFFNWCLTAVFFLLVGCVTNLFFSTLSAELTLDLFSSTELSPLSSLLTCDSLSFFSSELEFSSLLDADSPDFSLESSSTLSPSFWLET